MSVAVAEETSFLLGQQKREKRGFSKAKIPLNSNDLGLAGGNLITDLINKTVVLIFWVGFNDFEQTSTLPSSKSKSDEIVTELAALYKECSVEGWDGYGAAPVNEEAVNQALLLSLTVIAGGLPVPEFTADPDGEVSLNWYGANSSVISVSIGPTGHSAWAAELPDSSEAHGAFIFKGDLDDVVKKIITKVSS